MAGGRGERSTLRRSVACTSAEKAMSVVMAGEHWCGPALAALSASRSWQVLKETSMAGWAAAPSEDGLVADSPARLGPLRREPGGARRALSPLPAAIAP